MYAQEVFTSNKISKKAGNVFKNGRKKLFSLHNVMKKIVRNALFFRKKLSASPKNGTLLPPIKNNGPSLVNPTWL